MPADVFIFFVSDTNWRLCALVGGTPKYVDVSLAPDATAQHRAEKVSAALQSFGYAGEPAILAVPSSWCYAASIATDDLPKNDRKAMVYRLEEKLPLAAESLIADFILSDPPQRALGISISTDLLKDLVEGLEAVGVSIQCISPAALLAAQGIPPVDGQDPYILLCADATDDQSQLSLIAFESGRPVNWALLPADVTDIKLQLELVALDVGGSPHVEACGVDADLVDNLTEATGLIISVRDETVTEAAAHFATEIVAGRQRPWVDFRRGPLAIADSLGLHRRPINALLAAAAAMFIVFAGMMFFRGWRYDHAARAADVQLAEEFHQQFPGFAAPGNVRAVVESEYRKSRVRSGGSLPPEASRSALQTLHDVLDKLPGEGRFTIDRASFDDQGFQMEGRLKSYEDVDVIANAARQSGMTVDPPQARKDSQGLWSFTLHGLRATSANSAVATGRP
jgi:hypothetical protein